MLRGTSLDNHTFVSSKGLMRLMRVTDLDVDVGLPLVFSLWIGCVCTDGADVGCGAHSSCVGGLCKCDEGYGGGMCETIIDHCKFPVEVSCGAHGSCIDGSCVCESAAYSGNRCQYFDTCYGVQCGAHGDCVNGNCDCKDRYTGSTCTEAPLLPCCSRCGGTCGTCRGMCGMYCGSDCGQICRDCDCTC